MPVDPQRANEIPEPDTESGATPQGGTPRSDTIDPARMREISARLAGGSYEQPEVLDQIARRLLPEIGYAPD